MNNGYLRLYKDSDYNQVVHNVVSEKGLLKYLNKSFLHRSLNWLNLYKSNFYVLENEFGTIVAAGVIREKVDSWYFRKSFWLYGIEVKKEERGKGYGECLVSELINVLYLLNIKQIFLKVKVSNKIALNLYSKLGFYHYANKKGNYILAVNL